MKKIVFLAIVAIILSSFFIEKRKNFVFEDKELLSAYQFFDGKLADLKPKSGVVPYQLNTPLFSDYAEKARFIKLPEGASAKYNAEKVFEFPEGTILIKTFYYPNDFRDEYKGRRIMETRLLVHESEGWKALVYVWNEEQTDAILEVAGESKLVQFIDNQGKKQSFEYAIPNLNQCKGCHNYKEVMIPIGPSARQLNGDYTYAEGTENQLIYWKSHKLITGLEAIESAPKAAVWNDPNSGSLNDRARAWLDINCAHCHNENGPAKTSGMFLTYDEKDFLKIGLNKTPVAAGKGSGGRKFGIVPKKPDASILLYRLESTDPGEMMPEVGRKLAHKEGINLIRDWIKNM